MTNHEILKDARAYYQRNIREIYNIRRSALWTPDTHKIWEHICRIVALTYHDQDTYYSAKLEYIDDVDGANELAIKLIDAVLPILKEREKEES